MYDMQSISWLLFLFVPITTCVFDITGKLFSNLYYPTQTQIHTEISNTVQKPMMESKDVASSSDVSSYS